MDIKFNFDMKDLEKNIREKTEEAIKQGKLDKTIERECPNCHKTLEVPVKDRVTVECPHCKEQVTLTLNISWDK